MNWFKQIFKKAQLNFPLSIIGLRQLLNDIAISNRDFPGQQYLIQGPEVSDLQRLRSFSEETKQKIISMLQLLNGIFVKFDNTLKDEVIDRQLETGDYELEEEINRYVEIYVQDFDFSDRKDEEMFSFLASLDDDDQNAAWNDSLRSQGIPSQDVFNQLLEAFQTWANQVERAGYPVDESLINDIVEKWKEADTGQAESDYLEAIVHFTSEVMVGPIEHEIGVDPYHRRWSNLPDDSIPPWIDKKKLEETLSNDFDSQLEEWYKNENRDGYGGLEQTAAESIGEMDFYNFEEEKRELQYKFGFDVVQYLLSSWDINDDEIATIDLEDEDDSRLNLDVKTISRIANSLKEKRLIEGAKESSLYALMNMAAILATAESDENLKFIFSHEINSTQIDPNDMIAGIEKAIEEGKQPPAILQTETVQNFIQEYQERQQRAEEERRRLGEITEEERKKEQERLDQKLVQQRQRAIDELKKKEEEKRIYHHMLEETGGTLTPEQLKQMKELGIAKKPFGHVYELHRSTFPGAGFTKIKSTFEPFRISISPTQEERSEERKIPLQLFREMTLHTTSEPAQIPAIGWIGGYADYKNKIMYISEVQSDVMQRTVHMRDPEKTHKLREKEISRLENEISKLQQSASQTVSPREKLKQTIDRIRQETENLENQNANPAKIQKNKDLIDRLLQQYMKTPETVDTSRTEEKINQFTRQLQQLRQQKPRDFEQEEGHYRSFSQWHEYKSKVENAFKEWIPIFFNIAIREANRRGFQKLRIISAESLKKIWAQYSNPKTEQLFKRIYDDTAKKYNAKKVEDEGLVWFELDLGKARFASMEKKMNSWFKKAQKINKQSTHEWSLPLTPGGDKFVWQIHLDKFFEILRRKSPELTPPEFGANLYEENEANREIFNQWLDEVPEELKVGNDLEPEFKQAVRQYVIDKYNFDPYELEEEKDIIPSAAELESWWGD